LSTIAPGSTVWILSNTLKPSVVRKRSLIPTLRRTTRMG
jgi:hypothetical protein